MFLNDDVKIGDNFIEDLLKPFSDPLVAMVGAKCSELSWGINGAVMCVRREIFEKLGGFDENYVFTWEDRDLCENARHRGYKIAISGAKAEHKGKRSVRGPYYDKYFKEGEKYYHQKWDDKKRIIGAMVCGNEEGRYLEMVVADLFKRKLIDELVAVCDGCTDKTPMILKDLKKRYSITIYNHDFHLFGKAENRLRERAIDYAISKNPLGILVPDADEIFDKDFKREKIYELLNRGICWDFLIAHLWQDDKTCRIDGMYGFQKNARLFKYLKDKKV